MRSLGYTSGQPYSTTELALLDRFLAGHARLPPAESGEEGRIRFADVELAGYFAGWRIWRNRGPKTSWDGNPLVTGDEELLVTPALPESLGPGPRAFLLWENSD